MCLLCLFYVSFLLSVSCLSLLCLFAVSLVSPFCLLFHVHICGHTKQTITANAMLQATLLLAAAAAATAAAAAAEHAVSPSCLAPPVSLCLSCSLFFYVLSLLSCVSGVLCLLFVCFMFALFFFTYYVEVLLLYMHECTQTAAAKKAFLFAVCCMMSLSVSYLESICILFRVSCMHCLLCLHLQICTQDARTASEAYKDI